MDRFRHDDHHVGVRFLWRQFHPKYAGLTVNATKSRGHIRNLGIVVDSQLIEFTAASARPSLNERPSRMTDYAFWADGFPLGPLVRLESTEQSCEELRHSGGILA